MLVIILGFYLRARTCSSRQGAQLPPSEPPGPGGGAFVLRRNFTILPGLEEVRV